jgi:hypothetical protein
MSDDTTREGTHSDPRKEHERDLAAHHEARGTSDPLHGAIHSKHSTVQMNSWEIAKVDLSSELRIAQELIAEKGEQPASLADEASHGKQVLAWSRRSFQASASSGARTQARPTSPVTRFREPRSSPASWS